MDTLADGLKNLDVNGGGTAIVAIVLKFVVTDDTVQALGRREGQGGTLSYTWNNGAGVEGKYGGVCVDFIWIKDLGEGERFQNGRGKIARKRVFVRTAPEIVRGSEMGDMNTFHTWCIGVLWLRDGVSVRADYV